ncbi:NAD(P)-binding protein [Zopfia rhizophila CBS 207.26]|uniref:NAD(P)-binding protein n=1 Tax=Zopfia rhizophila CBS 207.26 TaxID=1314779 RepID=A0A6A6DKS5_9PEZI|nr:NAD(P)-binding protein [Zopfia rhizophila CBS 207.26]
MANSVSPTNTILTSALVIGGCGFLGSHIVEQLLHDAAVSVAVVSRKPRPKGNDLRVSYHAADITDEAQILALFDKIKPHVVIHTASPHYTDSAAALLRTNVEGTKVLLKSAKACLQTCAFVYTSSDSAVVQTQFPLAEEKAELYNEIRFANPYGKSKAIANALVLAANSSNLHLPAIYGENDNNFIPQLLSSVRKKEHKMQVSQNKKLFGFIYVQKAAEAHVLTAGALLRQEPTANVAGEAFFITDGKPQPFFDFSRKCYAAAGHPVAPEEVTTILLSLMQVFASAGECAYKVFTLGYKQPQLRRDSIDHLDIREVGYEPVADQDEAIKRSMEWAMASL